MHTNPLVLDNVAGAKRINLSTVRTFLWAIEQIKKNRKFKVEIPKCPPTMTVMMTTKITINSFCVNLDTRELPKIQ